MYSNALESLQEDFCAWLLGEPNESIESLVNGAGIEPGVRLKIYHNIVFNNLTEALATAYPTVKRLVGDDFFEGAGAKYIRDYPSTSGKLQEFGRQFGALLADMPAAADFPYLPDVARLEWARQESALAPLAAPVDLAALAAVPTERYDGIVLTLNPSVRLITSAFPVLDIWRYCEAPKDRRLRLDAQGQQVAVWRSGNGLGMAALDAGWFEFLAAIRDGATLASALDVASDAEADFDPAGPLRWLFSEALIAGIHQ